MSATEYKQRVPCFGKTSLVGFVASVCIASSCRGGASHDAATTERTPARVVSASPEPVEFGQVARNSFFEMTARSTKTCTVEAHFRPGPGVQKLGVEVEVTGLSDLEVPVNPFYAELRDDAGQRFESTLAGCTPVLAARRVQRGETQSGWLTFDVPEGARHLQLRYEPIVIGVGRVPSLHRLDR